MESDTQNVPVKRDHRLLVAVALALAIGLWAGGMGGSSPLDPFPNPFAPPKRDRPFLRFLAHVARTGLWIMLCADKPPEHQHAQAVRHQGPGPNEISHAEGW